MVRSDDGGPLVVRLFAIRNKTSVSQTYAALRFEERYDVRECDLPWPIGHVDQTNIVVGKGRRVIDD